MSKKKETKEERSERRRKELRLALRVFRYFLPYKWAMVVALLASAVVSGTTAGTAWLIKPALDDIRAYCADQLTTLWPEVLRFDYPHNYYVDLSEKLLKIKLDLLNAGGKSQG